MDFLFKRIYRGPLRAVILDWAGTTMDYGCCAPAAAFINVFKRHGIGITMAEAREPMGANKREHVAAITRMARVSQQWRAVHGSDCTEAAIDALYADFIPMQVDCLPQYADLIPGVLEAVKEFRARGIKIGSTTGYSREMMDVLIPLAKQQGYEPGSTVTATEVAAGRPAPWMALRSAEELNVHPLEAIVKIGDTVPDIGEGLNGGMWTIGVAKTGNETGLSLDEIAALDPKSMAPRLQTARARLARAGAHFVVDGIHEVPAVLDVINERLATGEKP